MEASPPGTLSREPEVIFQRDRNVTDKNILACFWDLSMRWEVWPVWSGVKAQAREQQKATERGQSCVVGFPHYKMELGLLSSCLSLVHRAELVRGEGQNHFIGIRLSRRSANHRGSQRTRQCVLCIMTFRSSFLHITRDTLKEQPLQDLNVRNFEWHALVCSPQSTVILKY